MGVRKPFLDEAGTYTPWPTARKPWQPTKESTLRTTTAKDSNGLKLRKLGNQETDKRLRGEGKSTQPPTAELKKENLGKGHADPDYRRAVVSIRLSAEELMMLRQRAAESGISVSEYVRSCVVEADRLRVQVKQAVADMRSRPVPAAGMAGNEKDGKASPAGVMRSRFSRFLAWYNLSGRWKANQLGKLAGAELTS